MEPDPGRAEEVEGVLNPAAVRDRNGELLLFPRMVGQGNFSRVGKARVLFGRNGDPIGVERQGCALEPEESYEMHGETGGCEDPRITYFRPLDLYLMLYTAWGPTGPRIALAVSEDLSAWRRTGLVEFDLDPESVYCNGFDSYHNKDGLAFPEAVPGPDGRPSLALIHRPVYETAAEAVGSEAPCCLAPCGIEDPRASIWISFCPLEDLTEGIVGPLPLRQHYCLLRPQYAWEDLRVGGGAPPLLTRYGWLLLYHGVSGERNPAPAADLAANEAAGASHERKRVVYRAGAALLDPLDPRRVLYRSPVPILEPKTEEECHGVVGNVVFPTGLDVRHDLNRPNRVDVYYGMADDRIGAASLALPD